MKILTIEPERYPREVDIEGTLESMQAAVGGFIEAVYPYEDPVALVCNEEGKLSGLPLNRALRTDDGEIYDVLAGTFFICGVGEENFGSLSPELMAKYTQKFSKAETFMQGRNGIVAIPFTPSDAPKANSKSVRTQEDAK